MKPKNQARLLLLAGHIVGGLIVPLGSWIAAVPIPTKRSFDMLVFVFLTIAFAMLGGSITPLCFWDWFYCRWYQNSTKN